MASLMGILAPSTRSAPGRAPPRRRAAARRSPAAGRPAAPAAAPAGGEGRAGIDAAIIDELIRIAADNDVTVDWLMLRAVKLYVEEYRKTGRL